MKACPDRDEVRVPVQLLNELVSLSNRLGDPGRKCAIVGEGNTSAKIDDESFWVKASGSELYTAGAAQFVRLSFARVLAMLEGSEPSDEQVTQWLLRSKLDGTPDPRPSTEALVHAVCLQAPGVRWVAHTHPTAVNAITCSQAFERFASRRLFPDHVVVCGPEPLLVPYVDPGVPLARELARRLQEFIAEKGVTPKEVFLQNHGLIALGRTSRDAENITRMSVKAAEILGGAMAFGGPRPMPQVDIDRIASRSDEMYRQRVFGS
jgi:rhamnose utilization protein RhaD (predicted bifunctional aldolase and dehydrogenase)